MQRPTSVWQSFPVASLAAVVLAGLLVLGHWQQSRAQEVPLDEFGNQPLDQRQLYCMRLEQRLAQDSLQSNQARSNLPQIQQQLTKFDRQFQQGLARAEQTDCFDYFLFSKEWRQTPRCNKIRRSVDEAQQMLGQLQQQLEMAASGTEDTTRQDALIMELARNNCGPQYLREAKRRANHNNFFWNNDEGDPGLDPYAQDGVTGPGFATYRTLCVRTCDGFYFPISFATSQSTFERDAQVCQARCAAPARLFVYQNPGAEVDQAVSIEGRPYTSLNNAFRYRRELVKGCSCKAEEYAADQIEPESTTAAMGDFQTSIGTTGDFGDFNVPPGQTLTTTPKKAVAKARGSEPFGSNRK